MHCVSTIHVLVFCTPIMKIVLILVGKTTDKHLAALCDNYVGRLSHYAPFEIKVVPDLKNARSLSELQQKTAEGDAILRHIQRGDYVVLLDEHGSETTSVGFAQRMQKYQLAGHQRVVFVIGGPYGLSDEVKARQNELFALSQLTFSHQMVRLIFLEQLYRAFTILRGEPYHHE